jgi:penicillin-binding protein 1A
VKFKTASGIWAPHNYKPEYLGALTLRTALAKSINTISAQLVAQMGVDAVVDMMRRLGITSKVPHALSLALGTADLGLEETAYALATFPAGGRQVSPVFITRLVDADGRVLEDHTHPLPGPQRLTPEVAYVVTDLMKGVVEIGTAKKARELGRPAAGKTGTSTNYRDAWFYGFTPELLCGVWVGRDDFKPVGHDTTGGAVAVPIWLAYMREALRDVPVREFQPPPGILFVRADPDTGVPAPPTNPKSRLMPFRRGTLPAAFTSSMQGARFSDEKF